LENIVGDIRQQITDEIIKVMEAPGGAPPWRKSWATGGPAWNGSSGNHYHGINQLLLSIQPYADPRWWTFRQADYSGWKVRKGAKGVRIVKMVEVSRKNADQEHAEGAEVLAVDDHKALVMKSYVVFNGTQIEGVPAYEPRPCSVQPAEAVEAIIWGLQDEAGGRMKLNMGAKDPCYEVRADRLNMPPASAFSCLDDFHSTLLHEAAHASGHPKRLARLHLDARFGSPEYAREELSAELASAFMHSQLGLAGGPDRQPLSPSLVASHAGYLASWLKALREDKNEIFRAAANAQRICDYLMARALEALPRAAPPAESSVPDPAFVRDQIDQITSKLRVDYKSLHSTK
jgi:antirestriction protein ArdC